jgi:hypothetical protein
MKKVLNFSTSAACPENVYVHGNYNPILKNLLPVTVANSLPPLLRKKIKYFAVFDGHMSYTLFFISIISNEFHSRFFIWIIFFSVTTKFLADLVCPNWFIYSCRCLFTLTNEFVMLLTLWSSPNQVRNMLCIVVYKRKIQRDSILIIQLITDKNIPTTTHLPTRKSSGRVY